MISAYSVFCRLAGADLAQRAALESQCLRRSLAAGATLFDAGEVHPNVHVVVHGVIRMEYRTAAGDTWVKGFAEEGVCFASLTALAPGGRTSYAASAATDAVVETLPFAVLEGLGRDDLDWQRALGHAYRFYGQRKEKREMELLTLSPEQRYLQFLQDHPALAGQLRMRDIASFIRITPVALSRIRSRLKARGAA